MHDTPHFGQPDEYAYVDESGDPNLELGKAGTSSHYVVAAILVDSDSHATLEDRVERVRSSHFGTGEMKSSSVGGDYRRRCAVIEKLLAAGVKFAALVTDKSDIWRDSGLRHRHTYIKYLHGQLYKRLYRAYAHLHVRCDQHGSTEFMQSFEKYLQNKYQRELFDTVDFTFVASELYPLVQAADMIAGTLARIRSQKDPPDLLQPLSDSAIIIESWPPRRAVPDSVSGLHSGDKHDQLVAWQSILLAREFILEHATSDDQDIQSQVETLHYLLFRYESDPTQYTYGLEILDHVNSGREEGMSPQTFRMKVIAVLRSQGVIIASSSKGYKIPSTSRDIEEYVSLVEGQTIPYLKRLAIARNHLRLVSSGEYDIVDEARYFELAKCIKSLSL